MEVIVDEGPVERCVQSDKHGYVALTASGFHPSTELRHGLVRFYASPFKIFEGKAGYR
jgi:hypothetical protein